MNQSLLECERIDERFQSGTRRARRTCSINSSLYFGIEEIARTDLSKHIHAARIDQQRGGSLNPTTAIRSTTICDTSRDSLLLRPFARGDTLASTFVSRPAL